MARPSLACSADRRWLPSAVISPRYASRIAASEFWVGTGVAGLATDGPAVAREAGATASAAVVEADDVAASGETAASGEISMSASEGVPPGVSRPPVMATRPAPAVAEPLRDSWTTDPAASSGGGGPSGGGVGALASATGG
jgi:hypothetical protein